MSEKDNNRQWLRYFRLVVAVDKDNQQAIDLSEFRCNSESLRRSSASPALLR